MKNVNSELSTPYLTVAVICKNEAKNIQRCLESVLQGIEASGLDAAVLVVDSFSTDETIEIAKTFPVTILQLGRDWPHSPAAGRYTAVLHATGTYLLVIDADMELLPGFLEKAIAKIEEDPAIAAVRGRLHNFYTIHGSSVYVNTAFASHKALRGSYKDAEVDMSSATGSALFRVESLVTCGNFHPFLQAEEEYEVCWRLRRQGGRLVYIPVDAVNHYGYNPDPFAEIRRRIKRGLVGGIGQMARVAFQESYGIHNLLRFKLHLALALFIASFPVVAALSVSVTFALPGWCIFLVLLFLIYWIRKKSLKAATAAIILNCLIGIDIFRGLFVPVPPKEVYPTNVEIF